MQKLVLENCWFPYLPRCIIEDQLRANCLHGVIKLIWANNEKNRCLRHGGNNSFKLIVYNMLAKCPSLQEKQVVNKENSMGNTKKDLQHWTWTLLYALRINPQHMFYHRSCLGSGKYMFFSTLSMPTGNFDSFFLTRNRKFHLINQKMLNN